MTRKLRIEKVNKNSSIEVKHYINKIKEQEKKYTFFLVVFFMILFCIIGYVTLSVNKESLAVGVNDSRTTTFVLTKDNIMDDEIGLSLEGINISIKNDSSLMNKYRIVFRQDPVAVAACGCSEKSISNGYIKYSLNKGKARSISSLGEVILEEDVNKGESKDVNVKMWLDKSLKIDNSSHFHGRLVVEKIKE